MRNKIDLALVIPHNFDKDLAMDKKSEVQVLVDAINGSAAQLSYGYLLNVIASYSKSIFVNMTSNRSGTG